MKSPYLRFVVVCGLGFVVCSCATQREMSVVERQAAYNAYDVPARLPQNPANVRVKVSLDKGITYVMEGDAPLLVMPVGVGKASTPTPQGHFRIYHKEHRRRANTHGLAVRGDEIRRTYRRDLRAGERFVGTPMPYWTEFRTAYGFHTGWIRPYGHTHGCIRMHHNVAPKFFRIVPNGAPVHIARTQPEDETLGRDLRWPPSAEGLVDHPLSYYLIDRYFTDHKKPVFQ